MGNASGGQPSRENHQQSSVLGSDSRTRALDRSIGNRHDSWGPSSFARRCNPNCNTIINISHVVAKTTHYVTEDRGEDMFRVCASPRIVLRTKHTTEVTGKTFFPARAFFVCADDTTLVTTLQFYHTSCVVTYIYLYTSRNSLFF